MSGFQVPHGSNMRPASGRPGPNIIDRRVLDVPAVLTENDRLRRENLDLRQLRADNKKLSKLVFDLEAKNAEQTKAILNLLEIAAASGKIPDPETARLIDETPEPDPRSVAKRDIIRAVCEEFDLDKVTFLSTRRDKAVVRPRFAAVYIMKHYTTASYPMMARFIGRDDHTTAINAARRAGVLMKSDDVFREHVHNVLRRLDLMEDAA